MTATLQQIEQELAARVGPFRLDEATGGTTTTLLCDSLISSVDQGTYENLYLLRRGLDGAGNPIVGVPSDRVRMVAIQQSGTLTVDRPWTYAPVATELFELHHLHPVNELRPSALAGLRRCYFTDRVSVALASVAPEFDLTALIPWVTRIGDVEDVAWNYPGAQTPAVPAYWFRAYQQGGHIWLSVWPNPYPQNVLVSTRRPHFTLVNGITQTSGPMIDSDSVEASLEWAAAAGHAEAWRICRPSLQAVAQSGDTLTQKETADEFSRLTKINYDPPVRREQFSRPFSSGGLGLGRL